MFETSPSQEPTGLPAPAQIRVAQGIVAVETIEDYVARMRRARPAVHMRAIIFRSWRDRSSVAQRVKACDVERITMVVLVGTSEQAHVDTPNARTAEPSMAWPELIKIDFGMTWSLVLDADPSVESPKSPVRQY